jgi:hypothetical protein
MAANPLPRPRTETATFTVDATTVTGNIPSTGRAVANNTIDWKLTPTEPETSIQVSAVNGHYPFTGENSFNIPAGLSHTSTVDPNAPATSYPYGRNGGAAVGHIVVGQGMTKRGK